MAGRPVLERREPRLAVPKVRNEARQVTLEQLADILSEGAATFAGPPVTPETAMRSAAVYACVRLITGAIASLPLPVYRRTATGRERASGHPVEHLLNEQPNPGMTAAVFWETATARVLLQGDGIAIIGRNVGGEVLDLTPVPPGAWWNERKAGRLRYYAWTADGTAVAGFDQDDVLHFPGIGFDGRRSLSPIRHAARQAVGLGLAAEEFSARFFANNARADVVLKFPKEMTREQQEALREYWQRKHQGLANSHKPAVLTEGGDVTVLSMSAEDAQLIESRRFQVVDICRIYGVPPFMVGETTASTSWGSGIEQQAIGFVTYTLRPHLTRFEQELNRKLFPRSEVFCEFNVAGLLRGDAKSRGEYYRQALGGSQGPGWSTVNEVRRLENLPPVEDGDRLYSPAAAPATEASDA